MLQDGGSTLKEMVVSRVLAGSDPVWITLMVCVVYATVRAGAFTLRVTMSAETDTVLVAGSKDESTDTVAVGQDEELHRHNLL